MVIYLPAQSVDAEPILDELTPREIVRELDKHVVGPVSYTHLDVYKRQEQRLAGLGPGRQVNAILMQ